ncbi:MAG: WD40 repeat domain-containing protein [Treponema sp.]|nr:WD40 repeat domain-containing protein [Treponema sp.]
MAKNKKTYFIVLGVAAFIVYVLLAAAPVPAETILVNNWIVSLESVLAEEPPEAAPGGPLIPFTLGGRFGYVDGGGHLVLNREREKTVSLSADRWAEYDGAPDTLEIRNPQTGEALTLEDPRGYPVFLKGRIFLLSRDQTSLEELNGDGTSRWRYDYEAPLTCIDASETYVLTGTLDGMIDLLDAGGKAVFPSFPPGGSQIPVILGCRISSDGTKLAVVSGINKQRFLFLERYGASDYRITYHDFLVPGEGFSRELWMSFIEDDSRVVFERESGLGIYDVRSRTAVTVPLAKQERLEAMDEEGGGGLFFFVTGIPGNGEKRLTALRLPGAELLSVPFKSEGAFLTRRGGELYTGGGSALASFTLDKR